MRAAFPEPPYTTSSSGRSATSGSRLLSSIRSGASVDQERAFNSVPRGALIDVRSPHRASTAAPIDRVALTGGAGPPARAGCARSTASRT